MTDQRLTYIMERIEELTERMNALPLTAEGALRADAIRDELDGLFDEASFIMYAE